MYSILHVRGKQYEHLWETDAELRDYCDDCQDAYRINEDRCLRNMEVKLLISGDVGNAVVDSGLVVVGDTDCDMLPVDIDAICILVEELDD